MKELREQGLSDSEVDIEQNREEMLWKLQGFPKDAMPAQDEGDASTAAEHAYTHRIAEVKQKPVDELSHEELVWTVKGFSKDAMPGIPGKDEGDAASVAERAFTQRKQV